MLANFFRKKMICVRREIFVNRLTLRPRALACYRLVVGDGPESTTEVEQNRERTVLLSTVYIITKSMLAL